MLIDNPITLVWCVISLCLSPFLAVVITSCCLAVSGCTIGLRKWYTQVLLRVFEYGARLQQERRPSSEAIINGSGGLTRASTSERLLIERDVMLNADGTLKLECSSSTDDHLLRHSYASEASLVSLDRSLARRVVQRSTANLALSRRNFKLDDGLYFLRAGLEAIIEDDVTKRFAASELDSWNMLTRTSAAHYHFISVRLSLLWWLGWLVRWTVLLPFRLAILSTGLFWIVMGSCMVGCMADGPRKDRMAGLVLVSGMRLIARCFSAVIRFHNTENRALRGFCVANHTSPIDVIVLGCDNAYSLIGQRHGGILGLLQWAFSRATHHVWFERSDEKDRYTVANEMREHVKDERNLPVLIFPEGTCINNTTVMLFRKGVFEIDADLYPAAIKYDSRFADPFWNSSADGMLKHLIKILTSWAIVADVWYLPKQRRAAGESPVAYADRVRKMIARAGGLVELDWDGQLKRSKPRPEQYQRPKLIFADMLKTD